jgi:hypothetical protein
VAPPRFSSLRPLASAPSAPGEPMPQAAPRA